MVTVPIVLIGAALAFVSNVTGNQIAFKRVTLNSLVATIIWIICFFALLVILQSDMDLNQIAMVTIFGAPLLFVSDLCGNTIHLGQRHWNGIVSAIIWAALFVVISTLYLSLTHSPF